MASFFTTRANDIAFLGHLRTAADVGVPMTPLVHTWAGASEWFSEHSKHCRDAVLLPNPGDDECGYVDRLCELGRGAAEHDGELPFVVPSSDTSLEVFLNHEANLSNCFRLMGNENWRGYPTDITDKLRCAELLAKRVSGHIPRTGVLTKQTDADAYVFPVIVKPIRKDYVQSFYRAHGGLKAILVESADALRRVAASEDPDALLVQEYIPFRDRFDEIPFYLYADKKSKIRVAASGIKEHLQPAPFGTATVLRLSHHPELLELAQKIATAIGWRGTLMIEFIRDQRDGVWKVIELNTRPWLFHRFYSRHGIDFVGTFLRDAMEQLDDDGSLIVPSRELVGDDGLSGPIHVEIERVLDDFVAKEGRGLGTLERALDWLQAYSMDITYPFFEVDDPGPALAQSESIARTLNVSSADVRDKLGWN